MEKLVWIVNQSSSDPLLIFFHHLFFNKINICTQIRNHSQSCEIQFVKKRGKKNCTLVQFDLKLLPRKLVC